MEVYVNDSKIGSTNEVVPTSGEKPTHSPPLLMLGCHKTASDAVFRGYLNGLVDEFALWPETLELLSGNGTVKFLGGFVPAAGNIDMNQLEGMINRASLEDPEQQAAAVKIFIQLSNQQTTTPNTAAPGSAVQETTTDNSTYNETIPETTKIEGVDELRTMCNILLFSLLDDTRLPKATTEEAALSFSGVSESVSNVLSADNTAKWKQIQSDTETVGVMQLVNSFAKWHSTLIQAVTYTNVSKPFCYEIVQANLYIKFCKMRVFELEKMAPDRMQQPDYTLPSLRKLRETWKEMLIDRIAFPTSAFTDQRCKNRPVSFTFHYYGYAHQAAITTTNPMYIPQNINKGMDSRLMSIQLVTDKASKGEGDIDTSTELCDLDQREMDRKNVLIKGSHVLKEEPKIPLTRKLLLFENMTVTSVLERFCVWWNENLTDYGAWDKKGCIMTETSSELSKCSCGIFGIFSILATKTEPIEVPVEPYWVRIAKYILYGISAVAILIYTTVVLMSPQLKDMYHLIGANLAFAIFVGSIAMVITDFESVQTNRTDCAIYGTLIHICYGAVGTWMVGLGHATFTGITSGVIGGRLVVYMGLCWGLAFAGAGIPYIAMYPEMGYDPRCFIGWDNSVKWVFFAPQISACAVAFFCAMVIFCNLSTPALRKENLIEDYGSFCRGAAFLLTHLSLTWLFGLLTFVRFGFKAPNFEPIFQIFNALSGIVLLLCIGFGSIRFRSVVIGQTKTRRGLLKQFAFGKPSSGDVIQPTEFSSTANLMDKSPSEQMKQPHM